VLSKGKLVIRFCGKLVYLWNLVYSEVIGENPIGIDLSPAPPQKRPLYNYTS